MTQFEDRTWLSRDGLTLHYRDYPGPDHGDGAPGLLPVLCLHGLTRNARDFEGIAPVLAQHRRVLCPDLRGRGDSEYAKEPASYVPQQYVEDILDLLEDQAIVRFAVIGTSLGGLLTMALAGIAPERIAGAVINDVGPVLEARGLDRIREYVGQGRSYPTWVHAARAIEAAQGDAHPDQPLDFWIGKAKRLMALSSNGRVVYDYDMRIAEPFADFDPASQPDLWPAWEGLCGRPMLVLRGGLSDLLSAATLREMVRRCPGAQSLTLPRVGHTPTLDEPEARGAIERLLEQVD